MPYQPTIYNRHGEEKENRDRLCAGCAVHVSLPVRVWRIAE